MNLSNEEIVIISMVAATVTMGFFMFIKIVFYKLMFKRGVKRVNQIKQLIKNDEIEVTLININSEPQRMKKPDNDVGLIIDGKVYDDKNSYFLEEQDRLYIVGKKEDFVIALMGGYIGRR